MVPAVPAFGGIPGGPELLILLLILAVFVVPAIAIAVIVLLVLKLRSDDGDASDAAGESNADRIAELEAEVERLRERVGDDPSDRGGDDRS